MAWFDYWISMKKRMVRPNTVRNYTERYERNIDPVIGKQILSEVKPIQCQMTMNRMADEGHRISIIYQTRITLFNMLDYAYQNAIRYIEGGMKPKTLQMILGIPTLVSQ